MKQYICILAILLLATNISATSEQINETLYIYGESSVKHNPTDGLLTKNIDKVICINATCTEATISVGTTGDYNLDYELNYAPNETVYYTKIITLKQELVDSFFFGTKKTYMRTLAIDSVDMASYNVSSIVYFSTKNTFSFKTLDQTITFGEETITNATFFFTEMIMQDQYDLIVAADVLTPVNCFFRTIGTGDAASSGQKLGGLTGIFMNVIKKIPGVGTSIYNVLYPIMIIIQYVFNFSFTFLNLIINDWWYALLLLEIICFLMALTQHGYVDIMQTYINTHVIIITFIHHRIIIPLINLIITIIVTIRNMFRV